VCSFRAAKRSSAARVPGRGTSSPITMTRPSAPRRTRPPADRRCAWAILRSMTGGACPNGPSLDCPHRRRAVTSGLRQYK
jgi:hypothetical protein